MRHFVTKESLISAIHYLPEYGLTYVQNPKVASSTLIASLWTKHDQQYNTQTLGNSAHKRQDSPFCKSIEEICQHGIEKFRASTFFTVVRNPYVRLLSAYLNKVTLGAERVTWGKVAERYDITMSTRRTELTFAKFVRLLEFELPENMDHHFRPQYMNLIQPFAPIDRIGRLEIGGDIQSILRDLGIEEATRLRHSKGAAAKIDEHYDQETAERVRNLYRDDFELFGYDLSLDRCLEAPEKPIAPFAPSRGGADLFPMIELLGGGSASVASHLERKYNGEVFWHYLVFRYVAKIDKARLEQADRLRDLAADNWQILSKLGEFYESIGRNELAAEMRQQTDVLRERHKSEWPNWGFREYSGPLQRGARERGPQSKAQMPPTPPLPRPFATPIGGDLLRDMLAGSVSYTYRGKACRKSPLDLAIGMKMLTDVRPGTVIDFSPHSPGGSMFFADILAAIGCNTRLLSVHPEMPATPIDPRIELICADPNRLEDSQLPAIIAECARPLLVIESFDHTYETCLALMKYFKDQLKTGEYLVVEAGIIEDLGANWRYGGGPNLAIHDFFKEFPDAFEIATEYNDMFGVNATFHSNGYLRRK